jgi:hypothetical protein
MRASDETPLAAELARAASGLRARGRALAPLATAFDRLAAIERRLERIENMAGLWHYLAAGGRLN